MGTGCSPGKILTKVIQAGAIITIGLKAMFPAETGSRVHLQLLNVKVLVDYPLKTLSCFCFLSLLVEQGDGGSGSRLRHLRKHAARNPPVRSLRYVTRGFTA